MAARSRCDTSQCDYSERTHRGAAIGGRRARLTLAGCLHPIDQLLLFLDNKRRSWRRPITSGGPMEAQQTRRRRYRCEANPPAASRTVDQILVPQVKSSAGRAATATGLWGHCEFVPSRRRVSVRTGAG